MTEPALTETSNIDPRLRRNLPRADGGFLFVGPNAQEDAQALRDMLAKDEPPTETPE